MQIKNTLNPLAQYSKIEQNNEKKDVSATRTSGEKNVQTANAATSADTREVSTEGKLRAEAFSTAMSFPPVRSEKIAQIKYLVDQGEYQVDTKQLAMNLLKEDRDILGHQ